jgi:hypothetical protein
MSWGLPEQELRNQEVTAEVQLPIVKEPLVNANEFLAIHRRAHNAVCGLRMRDELKERSGIRTEGLRRR